MTFEELKEIKEFKHCYENEVMEKAYKLTSCKEWNIESDEYIYNNYEKQHNDSRVVDSYINVEVSWLGVYRDIRIPIELCYEGYNEERKEFGMCSYSIKSYDTWELI